jgi:hypothetical protein
MIIPVRNLFIIILSVSVFNCTNKSNNGPVKAQSFEWSVDNGPTQSAETISFFQQSGLNSIYATKGTTEIFLATTTTSTGTYSLGLANANMGVKISGAQWTNFGCDITISSNSNSLLKGSFNGTFGLVNVDTVSISGTFEDVAY